MIVQNHHLSTGEKRTKNRPSVFMRKVKTVKKLEFIFQSASHFQKYFSKLTDICYSNTKTTQIKSNFPYRSKKLHKNRFCFFSHISKICSLKSYLIKHDSFRLGQIKISSIGFILTDKTKSGLRKMMVQSVLSIEHRKIGQKSIFP